MSVVLILMTGGWIATIAMIGLSAIQESRRASSGERVLQWPKPSVSIIRDTAEEIA